MGINSGFKGLKQHRSVRVLNGCCKLSAQVAVTDILAFASHLSFFFSIY